MGTFRKFDYGEEENLVHYGKIEPPSYDFSQLSTPIYLYYGDKDIFFTPEHKALLIEHLGSSTTLKSRFYPGFGHLTFLMANTPIFVSDFIKDLTNDN